MTACVFCRILAGELPASQVYADERCVAFMDLHPINPGHLLVVSRQHAADLAALAPEDGAQLFRVAQRLAQAVRASGLPCEGINLFLADGAAAGQEVPHVHLHVVPRRTGDGFGLKFGPQYYHPPSRAELDRTAQQVREAIHL